MTDLESEADELRASLYIANKRIKELENETAASLIQAQNERLAELERAYAALYRRATWLENNLDTVVCYMRRRRLREHRRSFWGAFNDDYPHTAHELEKWLEERHGD